MDDTIRDFLAEAAESIDALDRALIRLEETPGNPELLSEIFRVMHTIKGTCGFLGLTRLATVAHAAEDVLGQFRDGALSASQESVSAILEAIDQIKFLLAQLEANGQEPQGSDQDLVGRLKAIAKGAVAHGSGPAAAPAAPQGDLTERLGGLSTVDCAVEVALGKIKAGPAGLRFSAVSDERLQTALRDGVWAAVEEANATALPKALRELGIEASEDHLLARDEICRALVELGIDDAAVAATRELLSAPQAAAAAPSAGARGAEPGGVAAQSIRVSVETLEQLMNVASELVLIRNQLLQTLRSQPDSPFAAPLQRLNHVTSELQESVMTTRMQPISTAWAKLPRIARDLAVELNKRIEVVMRGAETELDRQVLEMIRDPLTHMIRNAADHGLESPGERAKAGKPETGRIFLSARHEGSHIVIEIADDGRGLQPKKLRAKALARGLITPAEAESLSDSKVQQLIFHPGFSTAETVSGISGRGVGMDVVRTNIEKIGGAVELASEEGKGTCVTIRIPLTLTIVAALIVDCCGHRFAMPQSAVVELVGVGGGSGRTIEWVDDAPVLRLRDRLLPLIALQDLMHLSPDSAVAEQCILVVRIGALTFGIIVDRVFDTEEIVVKPAASVLRTIPYYSGATILGDGAVIMILDPKGIAASVSQIELAANEDLADRASALMERTPLLLFQGSAAAPKAVPLQLVARIEDVQVSRIEYANGRPVLQYRNRLMPLLGADGETVFGEPWETKAVIVFDDQQRSIGLVVHEILDIVEAALVQQVKSDLPGLLGSMVIADRVTDVLDISHFWRLAAVDAPVPQPGAQAAAPQRRALLIDPSPFQRNLLAPMLAMAGYRVVTCESAEAAAPLIDRDSAFDIVLMDSAQPGHAMLQALNAPVVGLFDDPLAAPEVGAERFSRLVCRVNRDEVLSSLSLAIEDRKRSAA